MNKNICEVCGTENEAEYKFCKNCGNSLSVKEEVPEPKITGTQPTTKPTVKNSQYEEFKSGGFIANDYSGVSAEEMAAFVGKKANVILPKFTKMEITKSKISWCWPAAILGYLLGPMGSALWFFYRKMYKPAVIFAVIGAVVTLITSAMTFGSTNEVFDTAWEAFSSGNFETALEILERIEPTETALTIGADFISQLTDIVSCVVAGIYGFYFYKNHCIGKITSYRSAQADQRFYKMGLAAVGGVSGGMLAVGILLIVAVENVVSFITLLASAIN